MTDLELFTFDTSDLRVITDEHGDPWFVAADVARPLGYRMASDMTRRLDEDEKGTRSVRTPGGDQDMTVISESGLYIAILASQVPEALRFKRWVTREVLPAIRRGAQSNVPAIPQTYAEALRAAADQAERAELAEARVAVLEPKAEVADKLLEASGDLSVRDAAQILTRAGIKVGERRLFSSLAVKGWIKRSVGDGRYRAIQKAVDAGWVSVLPQSHYHPRTGELVLDPPQIRVTPKGIQKLLADYEDGAL